MKKESVIFSICSLILFLGLPDAFAQQDKSLDQTKMESSTAVLPSGGASTLTPEASAGPSTEPLISMQPIDPSISQGQDVGSQIQKPDQSVSSELNEGVKITKEKLSLDLKGIDIIELFRVLSLKMGVTIVPSKSVSGRINIFLNDLTFENALDVILISQDLACDRKGNIIYIMTSSEYERLYGKKYIEKRKFASVKLTYAKPAAIFAALGQIKSDIGKVIADEATGTIFLIDIPEKVELMEATIKDLDQVPETEVFDIKYAKTADLKAHLISAITVGPGEVYTDERSSKVVISDLPEKMKKIRRMVKAFDEESRQVFIEAEIVQVSLKDEFQRGINWETLFKEKNINDLTVKGNFPEANSFSPSPLLNADYLKLAIGTLASDNYTASFSFLKTLGDTKILSRPRIAVLNNQEARILVGTREAYVTQTLSQSADSTVTSENIQFIDVGVKLNVTPTINTDGYVTMKIKPEVSSVRETLTTALKSVVPIVETSESESVIKVKDGTMLMIAGLMKDDNRKDVTGIPILSRIPILGSLFGAHGSLKKKTEIVVFLTPHIISGDVKANEKEIQKWIPFDIVPDDVREDIFSKKIEEIKVKKGLQEEEDGLLNEEMLNLKEVRGSVLKEKESLDIRIQEKMKGIKGY